MIFWLRKLIVQSRRPLAPPYLATLIIFGNILFFGTDSYLFALSSLPEPLCPKINKKGNFRTDLSQFLQYSFYPYKTWWHTTGTGPWTPSLSTWFPSHSVADSDVLRVTQSIECLNPCDTQYRYIIFVQKNLGLLKLELKTAAVTNGSITDGANRYAATCVTEIEQSRRQP